MDHQLTCCLAASCAGEEWPWYVACDAALARAEEVVGMVVVEELAMVVTGWVKTVMATMMKGRLVSMKNKIKRTGMGVTGTGKALTGIAGAVTEMVGKARRTAKKERLMMGAGNGDV